MTDNSLDTKLKETILIALDETFDNVHGLYLDEGTSLFETLATISAEEASLKPSEQCATIAAHVAHMAFYIEFTFNYIRGDRSQADWNKIWQTVSTVTPEEWEASQHKLRESVDEVRSLVNSTDDWTAEAVLGGVLALLMHNAYHLGEIRQMLCRIKPSR